VAEIRQRGSRRRATINLSAISEDMMDDTLLRTVVASPVGDLLLSERGGALVGVDLFETASSAGIGVHGPVPGGEGGAARRPRESMLAEARRQLEAYFAGKLRWFNLPLRPEGTSFQLAVWAALRDIPYGETISYSDLARRVGRPSAARAVGRAVGQNPLAIVVPCHRVVGASGALTGFAWGLERKRWLLELEAGMRRGS
jgi:methylated-DNA-[protein]-cysteine S-methyltransferase